MQGIKYIQTFRQHLIHRPAVELSKVDEVVSKMLVPKTKKELMYLRSPS